MDIKSKIAHYETLSRASGARLTSGDSNGMTSWIGSALESFNVVTNLKRSPALLHHRRKLKEPSSWRQSIKKWQEQANRNRIEALNQRNLEVLG